MVINYLAELPWKQLLVKQKLKDAVLAKSLAKLDGEDDLATRLAALSECRSVALKLAKDKTFAANDAAKEYLEEVADAAAKECAVVEAAKKTAEKKAADAAKKAAKDEDEDDEADEEQEEGDLAGRLVKGLAAVKTGGGKVSLPFAMCPGSVYALLVSKRISSKDKKDLLELAGGKKLVKGICTWEDGKHTFIQDKVQAGLAGKVQKALKERAKLTCKVRFRDLDGTNTFDGDTDVDPEAALTGDPSATPEQTAAGDGPPTGTTAETPTAPPPGQQVSSGGKDYDDVKASVNSEIVKIEAAIQTLENLKHADAVKYKTALEAIRKKFKEAVALEKSNPGSALAKMEAAEALAISNRTTSEAKVVQVTNSDKGLSDQAKANLKKWAEDKLAAMKLKPTAIGTEIADVGVKIARVKDLIAKKQYAAANNMAGKVFWDCEAALKIAAAHGAYDTKRKAFDVKHDKAKLDAKIVKKEDVVAGVEAMLAPIAALVAVGVRDYAAASAIVDQADAALALASKKMSAAVAYDLARDGLTKKVGDLEASAQASLVKTQTDLVRTRLADAKKLADAGDFDAANSLLKKAEAECDAAAKIAASQGTAVKDRSDAQAAIDGIATDAAKAQAAVQKLLDALKANAGAPTIAKEIAAIEKWMQEGTAALNAKKTPTATKAFTRAADDCVAANLLMERRAGYESSVKTATARVEKLEAFGTKAATAEGKSIRKKRLDAAAPLAKAGKFDEALALIDKVDGECATAEKMADALKRYEGASSVAGSHLKDLSKHKKASTLKAEIKALTKKLADAAKKGDKADYEGALGLLAEVEDGITQAVAFADLRDGTEPTEDVIKKVAAGKGGPAALDKLIEELGPAPKAKLMKAALEARFGAKIERKEAVAKSTTQLTAGEKVEASGEEGAEDLKKMYELLLKVPTTHTKENPMMKKIETYKGGSKGSFYSGDSGLIVISADRPGAIGMTVGKPAEVPDAPDECKPVPDEPGKPLKYFDWTALHEVGHAVDDKAGFMRKNGKNATYGGWQEYGGDFAPAVAAAFSKFQYDKGYIEDYFAALGPTPVPAPTGPGAVAPNVWEKRRTDFVAWHSLVWCSTGNGPAIVGNGAAAKNAAIGGVVHQEAYPGTWVSYDIAARGKGLTGYQFRAPAEWFAELYAAYEIGKLKPNHPAVAWLEKL